MDFFVKNGSSFTLAHSVTTEARVANKDAIKALTSQLSIEV